MQKQTPSLLIGRLAFAAAAALLAPAAAAQQPEAAECAVKAEAAAEKDVPPLPADASDRDRILRTQTASRYFNKPGATVEDFVAAGGRCDRIARGCQSPTGHKAKTNTEFGSTPFIAMESSGMGFGLVGALISGLATAPLEGHRIRLGRRSCLLLDGWRMVEPDEAEESRIKALESAEEAAFMARAVGEATPANGRVTVWTNAMAQPGPGGPR